MLPSDLLALNVNEHTEKKNGLTYLSWAWGWDQCLRIDPCASFEVMTFEDKLYTRVPYMVIGDTAMVWVSVTLLGRTHTSQLPVMDHKNKPISVKGLNVVDRYGKEQWVQVDAFNVNTAIMRCLVKAIALHGLGLYIYAGEDLPMADEIVPPTPVVPPASVPVVAPVIVDTVKVQMSDENKTVEATLELDAELFCTVMTEYSSLATSKEALSNYWKMNQVAIDAVKASHPALFKAMRDKFSEVKAALPSDPTFKDTIFDQKQVSDILHEKAVAAAKAIMKSNRK